MNLADLVGESAARLEEAGVTFGQGTTDAIQEATWIAASVLGVSWDAIRAMLDDAVSPAHRRAVRALIEARIATRKPAAYLLHEAWLGPHRFYVDERVLVPRSFIFELLEGRALRTDGSHVLDLCTGSGCLAIVAALAFPQARVDAADISEDALAVARRNVADYRLKGRVRLVQSDLLAGLAGRRYDLIVSNPPYVKAASMRRLPAEFRREPGLALASGSDGLDHTRRIIANARAHLNPGGVLVVEIGHNRRALEKAYPRLPFEWPATSAGPGYVFTLPREALPEAR